MTRPPRKARRSLLQSTEVVGILPAEEAALNRALYASLQDDKKLSATDDEEQVDRDSATNSPTSSKSHTDDLYHTPSKRIKTDPVDGQFNDSPSPLSPFMFRTSSHTSSVSPHYSVGTFSSTLSSPASIGSSLKLILSTSSWSSSTESDWSPTPSVQTPVLVAPVKRGRGRPRKYPKIDPSGLARGSVHVNEREGSIFTKVAKSKPVVKGAKQSDDFSPKVAMGSKTSPPCKSPPKNSSSLPKTKSHKTASQEKTHSPKSSNKTTPKKDNNKSPLSANKETPTTSSERKKKVKQTTTTAPSRAVTAVLGPTSTETEAGSDIIRTSSSEQAAVQTQGNEDTSSTASSPCTFQAQRKFAQNHVHSPQSGQVLEDGSDSANGGRRLKKMPKTEDFISFLCLRSSMSVPESLHVFNTPWSGLKKHSTRKTSKTKSQLVAPKKLDFTPKALHNPITTKPPTSTACA